MPILEIEIVGEHDDALHEGLASRLAEAAAVVLASRPRGTWVKVRFLDPASYAENTAPEQHDMLPVFVSVLQRVVPTGAVLRDEVAALTEAIAAVCERPPDNVHILYRAPAAGRMAFGGTLVE